VTQAEVHARTAVVTGAGTGIGRSIALEAASRGATLWLLGRRADALEAVAKEARDRGAKGAHVVSLDVSNAGDAERFRGDLAKETDSLDLLVHSAGAHHLGPVAETPVARLDEQYQVNLRGPFVLTQLLLPLLRARRGQIVFVNSSAGLEARAGVGAYAATKHGLKALADALRQEVNRDGIRVISVFPGRTATPLQEAIRAQEGLPYHPDRLLQPEDVAKAVMSAIELPPTAEVTDIRVRPMQAP